MTVKWTPGPWTRAGSLVYANRPQDGGTICQVSEVRHSHLVQHKEPILGSADGAEIYANARLIAAAPELYEALAGLLDVLSEYVGWRNTAAHEPRETAAEDKARAALAKARGKP